jgi:two-component sensor histidine kinase
LFSPASEKPIATIAQGQDITERKLDEEKIKSLLAEKELILREVNHRIKNNMNTIHGLLILQTDTLKDPNAIAALEDSARRVQSMMVLYDKLYRSSDVQNISVMEYLPSLVDEIVSNFPDSKSVKIEKKIEDFILDAKRLQSLGIIINELLANIMKYAFTGRDNGLITIGAHIVKSGFKPNPAKDSSTVSIIIQDNGNGIPESVDFEHSAGFGLQLVELLTKELKGTIKIEREKGTKIILEFGI